MESADRSAAQAIVAYQAELTALEGALEVAINAHTEAQVANALAAQLAQHAATVDSLQAHMRSVSGKIEQTRTSAADGRERVSAARGI